MKPRMNASPGETLGSTGVCRCRLACGTSQGESAVAALVHGDPLEFVGGGAAGRGAPAEALEYAAEEADGAAGVDSGVARGGGGALAAAGSLGGVSALG